MTHELKSRRYRPARAAGVDTQARRETKAVSECPLSVTGWRRTAAVVVLEPIFEADLQPESTPIGQTVVRWMP